jgi:hypothetical protein
VLPLNLLQQPLVVDSISVESTITNSNASGQDWPETQSKDPADRRLGFFAAVHLVLSWLNLMALKKKTKKGTLLLVAIALSLVTLLFESFWSRSWSHRAQSAGAKANRSGMPSALAWVQCRSNEVIAVTDWFAAM